MPLFLLTNDDGIDSPGLWTSAAALASVGEVVIAAPLTQYTSFGRAHPSWSTGTLTDRSRTIDGHFIRAYAIDASPGQCVHYAWLELLERKPDLVVSGINYGDNVGNSITASGTVGAALDAASVGFRALAVSMETDPAHHYSHSGAVDFTQAGWWTRFFAEKVLDRAFPADVDVLKIEVPETATPDTPWRVTRVSRTSYYRPIKPERPAPDQGARLRFEIAPDLTRLEPDSDIQAVLDRVVSVTPISLDLTSRLTLNDLAGWLGS
jgi:5'-nucleotidase